ncbi:MAG: tryptophan-rich sensory protein, partial [Flavobacteriales bacterium]|nr:tryptophan-rich sensory protein [Flavobacteriales bacterium]
MKIFNALVNLLSTFGLIIFSYYFSAVGFEGKTISSLSNKYENLFTPESYAFSIWIIIFLGLVLLGIRQTALVLRKEHLNIMPDKLLTLLTTAIGFSIGWLWSWLEEYIGLSVIFMGVALVSLLLLMHLCARTRLSKSWPEQFYYWFPISLYSGWLTVAFIVNVSSYLTKIGWSKIFPELYWTIIMASVCFLVYLI